MKNKGNEIELKYLWEMIEYYGTKHYNKYWELTHKEFLVFFDKNNPKIEKQTPEAEIAKKKWALYSDMYWHGHKTYKFHFGWSVPTRKAVDAIVKFVGNGSILEIGAGLGVWAFGLNYYN
jgi:hypothetical protein